MKNLSIPNDNIGAHDKRAINTILLECGFSADLKGFGYLSDVIAAYRSSPHDGFRKACDIVALKHGVDSKTIMREISHAVSQAKDFSRLSQIVEAHTAQSEKDK